MVTKSTLAMAAIAFTLAFIVVSAYMGSLPLVTQKLGEGAAQAKTAFSPVINAWNTLPGSVKSVIMLGIPTLITLFFAWTKNRAMLKLQETKAEAAAAESFALEKQSQTSEMGDALTQEIQKTQTLETQLAVYEKDGDAVTALKEINTDLRLENESLKRNHALEVTQLTTERNIAQRTLANFREAMSRDPTIKGRYEDYVET